ncbi:class I SAM-dependent methyltransferase [Corynebacterium sp. ACRQM]|uniref:class I SAM-dependent methyltransferase n=1 Tax=unclassified Corynebacterium TaxID=2624378 RepID=UPI001EF4EB3B|nr:class I SAM-dependent methyltransferase [Corynebacterium sp. ACRPR]MCG7272525.1 class I SAM-dependent methyltransferase [Corynebacterium sp. ACRQM]
MTSPSHANQSHWDDDAVSYHAEHPEYLSSFYWCPEMLHEADAQLLGDVSSAAVLEIGCGSAACTQWLSTRARFVTGCDISRGMLAHAEPGLALTQADALALPYATDSFDVAFSTFGAFPFLADLDAALAEVARVVHPGGRFVFSVTHPMRWIFPDDPTSLTAEISYFDRAYLEHDSTGTLTYAEFHRTISDWFRALQGRGPFLIEDIIEPEWPEGLETTWGQWSPQRGEIFPGSMIFICHAYS